MPRPHSAGHSQVQNRECSRHVRRAQHTRVFVANIAAVHGRILFPDIDRGDRIAALQQRVMPERAREARRERREQTELDPEWHSQP